VAVYGIYFDTGKSDLKPESEEAIAEIAKLLKGDTDLKLYVVGHTDNVGALDANMKLSGSRAEAVLQALVRTHGIAASRLKSFGNGPYAPVATNDTDEGRAKNRRVELVSQ
jgi:outer membrane protein OmpA-like peptidoglycan-associated protein